MDAKLGFPKKPYHISQKEIRKFILSLGLMLENMMFYLMAIMRGSHKKQANRWFVSNAGQAYRLYSYKDMDIVEGEEKFFM